MLTSRMLSLGLAAYLTASTPSFGQKEVYITLPPAGPAQTIEDTTVKHKDISARRAESLDDIASSLRGCVVLVPIKTDYNSPDYTFKHELKTLANIKSAVFYLLGGKMDFIGFDKAGEGIREVIFSDQAEADIELLKSNPEYDIEDDGNGAKESGLAKWICDKKLQDGEGKIRVVPVERDFMPSLYKALRELGQNVYALDRAKGADTNGNAGYPHTNKGSDKSSLKVPLPIIYFDGKNWQKR